MIAERSECSMRPTTHECHDPIRCLACGVVLPRRDRLGGADRCWWCREMFANEKAVRRGYSRAARKYGLPLSVERRVIEAPASVAALLDRMEAAL